MATRRGGQQRIPRPASFRPGGAPPWAGLAPDRRRLSLDDIRARLADLPPAVDRGPSVEGSQAAAVLVPMYELDGEARVVLIKRPETMSSHRGEIAFPGGKFEAGVDPDLRATALREANEEIGLDPADVEVVARLDGIGTVATRFTITPFVGLLRERPALVPSPTEVVRILEVPLSDLLDPDVYRAERWDTRNAESPAAGSRTSELLGTEFDVHFYDLDDETVWGATARILTSFLAQLVDGR